MKTFLDPTQIFLRCELFMQGNLSKFDMRQKNWSVLHGCWGDER